MSPSSLAFLKQPISVRPECVATAPTTLHIKQASLQGVDLTVTREEPSNYGGSSNGIQQNTLFTVSGNYMSWSQKRNICDASGLPLVELYRSKMGSTWFLGLPGQKKSPLVRIEPLMSVFKHKFIVHFENAAAQQQETILEVRGKDIWRLRTDVYHGNDLVLTIKRTDKLKVYVPGSKLEWVADVAEGMDMLLASAITVVLSSTLYNSHCTDMTGTSSGVAAGVASASASS